MAASAGPSQSTSSEARVRPRPLYLTLEDRSKSWDSNNPRQARTPPENSSTTPLTGNSFRHRKTSMDVDPPANPNHGVHELRAHHASLQSRLSLDLRRKAASLSREPSPTRSVKSPLSAPINGARPGRFPQLFPPRPARLTHSMSDAPPSATPAALPRERLSLYARVKPWSLAALWVVTTLGFLIAIAFWKKQVFSGLDHLAIWLREHGVVGYLILYLLIFVTTIPPLPMYSTLITLAGYCFGTWMGAVVSYLAALTGAVVVFVVSRAFFPGAVTKTISASPSFKKVIRAIEKRPQLLFLIRLAPYPYNMMNVLLSSSPYLTLQTYTLVTALSLFKCIIYTYVGSAIHSFADYHQKKGSHAHTAQQRVMHIWGIIGIILCVGIMAYLTYLARKAVNDTDEDEAAGNVELGREEAEPFLIASPIAMTGVETAERGRTHLPASEIPYRTSSLLSRPFILDGPQEEEQARLIEVVDASRPAA